MIKNKKSILFLPIILAFPLYGGQGCSAPKDDGGTYKTVDSGRNWKQTAVIEESKNNLLRADIKKILVDPNNPNTVFLVTENQGLYVNNQFGEQWKRILPETNTVYVLEADPTKKGLFYSSILLNDRAKIVKSENGGQDWQEIYTETGKNNYITHVKVNPFFENSLMAVNSEGLVIRSSDRGNTWQAAFPFQEPVIEIIFDPVKENSIWALTEKGVWYSQDGGSSFNFLSLSPNGEMGDNFYLLRKEKDSLFLATNKGFFMSRGEGKVWRKIITLNNPASFPARDFVVFPGNNERKWAMSAGMTLYLTEDGGENWKPIQFEIDRTVNAIAIKPDDPNQILVGVTTASVGKNMLIGF